MRNEKRKIRAFWIRIGLVFLILMGFFINSLMVGRQLNKVVQHYIANSNTQLASQLAFQIRIGKSYIEEFAQTLERMPLHLLSQDLLDRKAQAVGMDAMFVVCRGERPEQMPMLTMVLNGKNLTQWAEEAPVWEQTVVSVLGESSFLISAPVPGERDLLTVGIKSYQKIQTSFHAAGSKHDGMYLLVDSTSGDVLMMQSVGDVPSSLYQNYPQYLQRLRDEGYAQDIRRGNFYACAHTVEGTDWLQISLCKVNTAMSSIRPSLWIYLVLVLVSFLGLFLSVYEMQRNARRKELVYMTDSLTGGYNREGFIARAQEYLSRVEDDSYCVIWVNQSEFRTINALWGEDAGNRALQYIYDRLAERIGPRELVCRSRMDRFILLLQDPSDGAICQRMEAAVEAMNENISGRFGGYVMRFIIGACRIRPGESITQAIANATNAGKTYKKLNKCVFYDDAVQARLSDEARFNEMFESAIQKGDFQVYLQPKVGIQSGGDIQAEALVRWVSEREGIIGPDKFIPLFERNGKICQLDLYVFEQVCRTLARWREEGRTLCRVSVNISRFHLRNVGRSVWQPYQQIKERYHIPDGLIEIELTETVMIDAGQLNFVQEVLRKFRACGFSVALDDFGFAFSSLGLLKEFEIDTMKLDRSFFVNENEKSRRIVENLIHLAHALDMSVVAEGVEQPEQVEDLRRMHCDFIQGYVYAKPLPIAEFEEWRNNREIEQR